MRVRRRAEELEKVLAYPQEKLGEVLPRMDRAALQIIIVVDEERRLLGTITDGDVRRVLLRGCNLEVPVAEVMNRKPRALPAGASLEAARRLILEHSIRHVPLVDAAGRVVDLLLWVDLFERRWAKRDEQVIIMAGGKGTRLDPFTKILPKPMIPLGDKPIVEVIMDRFYEQGFAEFILTLGYKAEVVRLYFAEDGGRPYRVAFVEEDEPLGTAGSLGLLKEMVRGTFVVTNCDVILELDYESLLDYHRKHGFHLTLVGALREFAIPYGVLRVEDGRLYNLEEKPKFHLLVNAGLYVVEPDVLGLVSGRDFIHMTDLIALARGRGYSVGVYPHHGRWFDIGQWEEYRQSLRLLEGR